MPAIPLTADEIRQLRDEHYNATLIHRRLVHDDLVVVRVRPDVGVPRHTAGQFTVLGLGYWESRVAGTQSEELSESKLRHVCKRSYSICCPLVDEQGRLADYWSPDYWEFYVSLVRQSVGHPPALTPRLFGLRVGDRLFASTQPRGTYTCQHVPQDADMVWLATGTGEAPHNAMLAERLMQKAPGRFLSAVCMRYRRDRAYLEAQRRIEALVPGYRYVTLTTREPENVDPARDDFVGKQYLQDFVHSGQLERMAGFVLDPRQTHIFLCGNPEMIGAPDHPHAGTTELPPRGMVRLLWDRGFTLDQPHALGNLHYERYW